MNRPNMNKNRYKNDYESEKLGANNLYRRFKNQFETLLAFDYNEGTPTHTPPPQRRYSQRKIL